MSGPIKVGLLIESAQSAAWVSDLVQSILNSDFAEITAIATLSSETNLQRDSVPTRRIGLFRSAIGTINQKLITLLHNRAKPGHDAFAAADLSKFLANPDTETFSCAAKDFRDRPPSVAISVPDGIECDVFIACFPCDIDVEASSKLVAGYWFLHQDGSNEKDMEQVCTDATVSQLPFFRTCLAAALPGMPLPLTIAESFSCTNTSSIRQNASANFWKFSALVFRCLRRLQKSGAQAFFAGTIKGASVARDQEPRKPTRITSLRLSAALITTGIRKAFQISDNLVRKDQWALLVGEQEFERFSAATLTKLSPPKTEFWADPHLIRIEDRNYLFFEALPYASQKGHIAVLEIRADGTIGKPVPVMKRPYHLSYPFVFEFDNDFYMIPETSEDETIQLHRCTSFPGSWELHRNLIEGVRAVDATLFRHDGMWWLFANISESPGISLNDELFLFYCHNFLTDDWTPFSPDPIVSDVRSARPAGPIFRHGSRIFRPSQDCSGRYGRGFHLNEITSLTVNHYEERRVRSIYPDWSHNALATHTFARTGNYYAIDAEYRIWR